MQPTMLLDVADGEPLWDEEVFGPVVCVRRIADVERAFDEVNRSRYGLHASIWTASLGYAFAALRGLDVGGVVVNELPGFRSDTMPHGPVKDSGTGCEGPRYAIEEFTVTRMAGDPSMTSVEPEHSEGAALDLLDRAATKTFAADVGPVDALVFTPAANVRKHVLTTGTRNSTAWLCWTSRRRSN